MKKATPYQGSALPLSYGSDARLFGHFGTFVKPSPCRFLQNITGTGKVVWPTSAPKSDEAVPGVFLMAGE